MIDLSSRRIKENKMNTQVLCDCSQNPYNKHVHILTQGELDAARHDFPHAAIKHDEGCTCNICK